MLDDVLGHLKRGDLGPKISADATPALREVATNFFNELNEKRHSNLKGQVRTHVVSFTELGYHPGKEEKTKDKKLIVAISGSHEGGGRVRKEIRAFLNKNKQLWSPQFTEVDVANTIVDKTAMMVFRLIREWKETDSESYRQSPTGNIPNKLDKTKVNSHKEKLLGMLKKAIGPGLTPEHIDSMDRDQVYHLAQSPHCIEKHLFHLVTKLKRARAGDKPLPTLVLLVRPRNINKNRDGIILENGRQYRVINPCPHCQAMEATQRAMVKSIAEECAEPVSPSTPERRRRGEVDQVSPIGGNNLLITPDHYETRRGRTEEIKESAQADCMVPTIDRGKAGVDRCLFDDFDLTLSMNDRNEARGAAAREAGKKSIDQDDYSAGGAKGKEASSEWRIVEPRGRKNTKQPVQTHSPKQEGTVGGYYGGLLDLLGEDPSSDESNSKSKPGGPPLTRSSKGKKKKKTIKKKRNPSTSAGKEASSRSVWRLLNWGFSPSGKA